MITKKKNINLYKTKYNKIKYNNTNNINSINNLNLKGGNIVKQKTIKPKIKSNKFPKPNTSTKPNKSPTKTIKSNMSYLNFSKDKDMDNNKDYKMLSNINGKWVYKFYKNIDDDTVTKSTSKTKRCMCINYQNLNDFQTYDRCTNKAVNDTDFCELHQNCKSYLRNFLSGYEPEYQPETWSNPYVEGSHNCYSYFLNRQVKAVKEKCNEICLKSHKNNAKCPKDNSECTDLKPQPGDFDLIKKTGSDKTKERIYKCPNMQKKILNDNPSLIPAAFNIKCPNKYYKGAMVVDPDNTYHFYRQNNNGTWDHKPGISPISNVDAKGNTIYIPHFANRDYTDDKDNDDDAINYTNFCGYYCIPENTYIHKNLA